MGCWYAIQKYMCAEELKCDTCVMQSDREIVFIGTNTLRVLVYVILEDAALGGQR